MALRRWLGIIVVLGVVAGAWAWWSARSTAAVGEPPATAAVARADVRRTVLATGVIEASRLVSVGALVSGQIRALPVELGQRLAAGDLVAQIDPEDQQNDLLRAEAALAQIEAQIAAQQASHAEAQLALDRKRQLAQRGLLTPQELEASEAQLAVAAANVKASEASRAQAQIAVESARVALERTRILAPVDGTVVAIVVREGQSINANQSSPTLVKIADLDTMVIKAEISEADIIHIRPGQKASFSLAGEPGSSYRATLRALEPAPAAIADSDEIDTGSAIYYRAALDVPNPDGTLRIGMTAEVTLILDEAADVLAVPSGAVRSGRDGGATVQVHDPQSGETSTREVETGVASASLTEIRSGLEEGELVVTGRAARAATATTQGQQGRTPGAGRFGPPGLF
ncbi:MAG TPA: efflux RND transporter periplasmic adaptor subunit [Paracoccus solventivorans]|uniref:Efflux RND transporter periplasmic adaptor subunit n=1 Tax=Paracoccus solventivorans TaxID=53463 RepID=A0A832QW72_9RHOB|nr:efflux RND transporter periplasmic adaptor subunit [Paracoccus solventivorans]HHW34094.1 efflux RND transporter periplasmic adaptor subunit [Paracoccus solventivorans]